MTDLLEFDVPAAAAEAIRLDQVTRLAESIGIADRRLAYTAAGHGEIHVSCSRDIALCVGEALRVVRSARGGTQTNAACRTGFYRVLAALDADDDPDQRWPDPANHARAPLSSRS